MSVPTCSHGSADINFYGVGSSSSGEKESFQPSTSIRKASAIANPDPTSVPIAISLTWGSRALPYLEARAAPRNDQSTVINILSHLLSWCSGVGRQHHSKRCTCTISGRKSTEVQTLGELRMRGTAN